MIGVPQLRCNGLDRQLGMLQVPSGLRSSQLVLEIRVRDSSLCESSHQRARGDAQIRSKLTDVRIGRQLLKECVPYTLHERTSTRFRLHSSASMRGAVKGLWVAGRTGQTKQLHRQLQRQLLLTELHPADIAQARYIVARWSRIWHACGELVDMPPQDRLEQPAMGSKNGLHDEDMRLTQRSQRLHPESAPPTSVLQLELEAPKYQSGVPTQESQAFAQVLAGHGRDPHRSVVGLEHRS